MRQPVSLKNALEQGELALLLKDAEELHRNILFLADNNHTVPEEKTLIKRAIDGITATRNALTQLRSSK